MDSPDRDGARNWNGFRRLCGMLGAAPFNPKMPWDAADWDDVIHQAQQHRVGPAVWRSIEGVDGIPNPIKAYFHFLRDRNARRNVVIADDLLQALERLGELGLSAVLVKGVASLAIGLYDDPAERFLLDADLLVAPDDARACVDALRALGFKDLNPRNRWVDQGNYHLPPLIAPSGDFCVELHTSLLHREFEPMLPCREILRRTLGGQWRGRPVRLLDPTDRFVHNIVHSQLHHELSSASMVELRQLRELSRLVARDRSAIDWSDVERRFRIADHDRTLSDQAVYCRMLMGVPWPVGERDAEMVMDRLRTAIIRPAARKRSVAHGLRKLIGEYAVWFARNPLLILNLVNPLWWPRRVRIIASLLKHGDDPQP